jgi:hypothetical protein
LGFQLAGHLLHIPTSTWHQKFSITVAGDRRRSSHIIITSPSTGFLAPLPGKTRLLQGEFRTHILYFVLSFALLYFYLHRFIKNTKKLVSFVVIFTCLLLVC